MSTRAILLAGLIIATAVAVACWVLSNQPVRRASAALATAPVAVLTPQPQLNIPAPESLDLPRPLVGASPTPSSSVPAPTPAATPTKSTAGAPPRNPGKSAARPPSSQPGKQEPPLRDPTARVALSYVGADPEAVAYWVEAIFDSTLPDQEREDLMEDLNEEGLSDHERPGPDDLPLILNRLVLLEGIAPEADEFMLPHLWEAYKDLLNLAEITQGRGHTVQ